MGTLNRLVPPTSSAPSKVAFPPFIYESLRSGAPVYIVENHLQPLVSISLYVRRGSFTDVVGKEARASLAMELMTKGTANRTAPQIADAIDAVGGSLSSHAGYDAATVSVSVLSKFLPQVLDLMADVVYNPAYQGEELDRMKTQRLAALAHGKSDPNYLADTLFTKLTYGPHSYALESTGTERSLAAMTPEDLRSHHQGIFRADELFFVVAGDITPEQAATELGSRFTAWSQSTAPMPLPQLPEFAQKPTVALVEKPQAVQSALRVGHLGIARAHADYIKCYGMNMILGGYFNSRINQNLRERNGFTYGARSYFDARKQTGSFLVSTEIRTEVTGQTVREILSEMDRMRNEFVTADELTTMKNFIIGSFPMTIETPQQVGARLAAMPLYGFSADYYDRFRDWVAELTVEDIRDAARTYLAPDRILIVASGDTKALGEQLQPYGEIEYFNNSFEQIQS